MALDYRAVLIVYADSDLESLAAFRKDIGEAFSVVTALSGHEALQLLQTRDAAVLLAAEQLVDMTGIELLRRSREGRSGTARLLTSRTLDVSLACDAINLAHVHGYVPKPWQAEALCAQLSALLERLYAEASQPWRWNLWNLWRDGQVVAASAVQELIHELSNPLGALELNAQLVADLLLTLADAQDIAPAARTALRSACEAQTDTLAAISQLKAQVSRMRLGNAAVLTAVSESCDVATIIEATVRIVRAEIEKVSQLDVQLTVSDCVVRMEASAFSQVLLNLLLNAAQAVVVQDREHNRILVRAQECGDELSLVVEDNGKGIAQGNVERVFDPFFTTKRHGTGLGLSICRELVSRARGTICVHEAAGGGACFEVRVPLVRQEAYWQLGGEGTSSGE